MAVAILIWAIKTAFTTVEPITQKIDKGLEAAFTRTVRIPVDSIPRPSREFGQITYLWEMETLDKEVIEVRFTYTPAYTAEQKEVVSSLEMTEKGDPSIFDKVLPALLADEQSLTSARDPQKANFGASEKAGFSKMAIAKDARGDKTIKITWTYNKEEIGKDIKEDYQKLEKYPTWMLENLYSIPGYLRDLVKG